MSDTPPDWMTDEWLRVVALGRTEGNPKSNPKTYAREILRLRANLESITAENLESGAEVRAANEESARLRAKLATMDEHVPTVAKMAKDLAETEAELDAARAEVERLDHSAGVGKMAMENVLSALAEAGRTRGPAVERIRDLACERDAAIRDRPEPAAEPSEFDAAIAEASDYFTEDPQTSAIIKAIKALAREVRRG